MPFIIDDIADEWQSTTVSLDECKLIPPYPTTWFEWSGDDGWLFGALAWDCLQQDRSCLPLHVSEIIDAQKWDRCIVLTSFWKDPKDTLALGLSGVIVMAGWLDEIEMRFDLGPTLHDAREIAKVVGFAMGVLNSQSSVIYADAHNGMIVDHRRRLLRVHGPIEVKTLCVKARGLSREYTRTLAENANPVNRGRNRRHLVRGGFRYFGPQYGRKRLFGKHEGCWYWRSHARGSSENGVIANDYSIVSGD